MDLDAYERLERLLVTSQPAVVGIEATENDFRKEFAAAQRPDAVQLGVSNWKRYFPYCNTETVALLVQNLVHKTLLMGQYLQEGRLVFCDNPRIVDSPKFEQAIMRGYQSSPELEKLVSMPPEQLRKEVAAEYAQKSYPVSDNPALSKFYSKRDQFACRVLMKQWQLLAGGTLVSIGGLDHLYADYRPNLFDRLADLNPVRMKLS